MRLTYEILGGTVLFAIPLMLVALGGMFSERSGIVNIALEGIMVIGALTACLILNEFNVPKSWALNLAPGWAQAHPQTAVFIAILAAGAVGALFSVLLAFASVNLRADQTIGGTALNMLAPALAIVLTWRIQGQGMTTILIPKWVRITAFSTGEPGFIQTVFFKNLLLTTPIALLLLIVSFVVLYYTRFGLRLRACGEHPQAADSVGINVYRMRYAGVLISGFLGGIGGFAYTAAAGAGFQSTVAGYGFLALAVMIFGNWNPIRIFGAALFFALFKVIPSYITMIPFLPNMSHLRNVTYLYQMLPYLVTMIVLILTSKSSRAPKAEGIPYDKGGR